MAKTIEFAPQGGATGKICLQLPNTDATDLDFARSSNGTLKNENGILETVLPNIPRYTFEDDGCPALLLEPTSTNEFTYSNDFTQSDWEKQNQGLGTIPIVTANYAISPDGTQNASRIQFDASTSGSGSDRSRIRVNATLTDGEDYTQSFYLKSTDGTNQSIGFLMDNSQATVVTVTSEWQRFEFTITQVGTSGLYGLDLRSATASTSDILVYQGQLEEKSYATSYIPTNGSIETRTKDTTSKSGLSNYINSQKGVLYLEAQCFDDEVNNNFYGLKSSTENTHFFIYGGAGASNKWQCNIRVKGFNYYVSGGSIISVRKNIKSKIAVVFNENEATFYINGVKGSTQILTSGFDSGVLDQFGFSLSSKFYGKVNDARVYTDEMTETELIGLTTI